MKPFLLIVALTLIISQATAEPTILTYFSEHEVEQDSDYIEIGITVHSEDINLNKAVKTAETVVAKLEKIVLEHCHAQSKKKTDCDDAFDASKHNIQPKYQLVRKVSTFMGNSFLNHQHSLSNTK
jgi:hypothetical protein